MALKKRNKDTLIIVLLILATVFAVFPILWMLSMSIRPNNEVFINPPRLIPKTFSLDGYGAVLSKGINLRFFLNSYMIAFIVTGITILISLVTAYGFSRFKFKGKGVLNYFIISTQTIPPITLLIPYFSMIITLRLFDTYAALIITYCGFTLPYSILMMIGYFNTLSQELDEAVLIDGGSRLYALFKVITPLSLPGIVATAVYTFLLSWNEYMYALTLTKTSEMRTIPIGIALMMGEQSYNWNEMMCMSILGSVPVLILYLFFQKFFISGMTAGSVKA